ncbi:unnamed protein product [Citrullus colocynthis]|uniref:Uncharacterized protein n=1 Tax=Citrullus colocynthis TaxID=252529 RepID=A0ABP0Y0B7_9ROSI
MIHLSCFAWSRTTNNEAEDSYRNHKFLFLLSFFLLEYSLNRINLSPARMEKTTENGGRKSSHVVVFAYPKHRHMSPMLQFAKRLASKGLRVTFLTTSSATQSLQITLPPSYQIDLQFIFDVRTEAILSLKDEHESFEAVVSRSLGDFIDGALRNFDYDPLPPRFFVVFDSVMPWARDVATERGLDSAPFFTESCAVNHILNQIYEGSLSLSSVPPAAAVSIPSLPVLQAEDLPFFPYEPKVVLEFMIRQFSSFKNAKWIFVNTYDQLEMKYSVTGTPL